MEVKNCIEHYLFGKHKSVYIEGDDYKVGFHRLSIIDKSINGDQPFAYHTNNRDIYVICNTCNTSECVWHIMCSCWTATLRTCIVWSVISVHCKTIHRLTNALFGGLPSFNSSRKLQAPSGKLN